jgi:hypothetical protein
MTPGIVFRKSRKHNGEMTVGLHSRHGPHEIARPGHERGTKEATHCLFDFLARSNEQRGHVLDRNDRGASGRVGARTGAVTVPSAHE